MERRSIVGALGTLIAASLADCESAAPSAWIVLIGDSTVADTAPAKGPMMGRGQALRERMQGRAIAIVVNHAVPGCSARLYFDRHWSSVRAGLTSRDTVLIQFGHVDALPDPERHTEPEDSYREILITFVAESRAEGAKPVLVTPVTSYPFKEGAERRRRDEYA